MDNYLLNDGQTIYPIMKIEHKNKEYLFYSEKKENVTKDDILIAEELNNELLPVSDDIINELIEKLKNMNITL